MSQRLLELDSMNLNERELPWIFFVQFTEISVFVSFIAEISMVASEDCLGAEGWMGLRPRDAELSYKGCLKGLSQSHRPGSLSALRIIRKLSSCYRWVGGICRMIIKKSTIISRELY